MKIGNNRSITFPALENSIRELCAKITAVPFGNFAKIKCATARNKLRSILGTFQGFHGIRANSRE